MRDLYVQTFLLEEFGSLNVMGFQRVLAKYDLRVKSTVSLSEEYVEAVAKSNFANTDDLTVMTTGLEKLYADTFENGNRRKAVAVLTTFLQSDPRTQPQPIPQNLLSKKGWIIDMDGVLYYQNHLLPGVIEFVEWLKTEKKRFLFLTNSSERSPKELQQKLGRLGIHVGETQFYNSSLSTAEFLQRQKPNGSAFVIGEAGLISALYEVGYTMNEIDPDYVVIGETRNYNYERMQLAVNLVRRGAKLIGTNVDVYDKALNGVSPGTACLVAPIELATGSKAYYLGSKPNPLMLRSAMRKLGCDAKDTVIIGDRMDTDIIGGIESGIETILVLSGVTSMDELKRYAYRPDHIMGSVSDIAALSKVHS
ncbi:hypothetical protein CAOG_009606 [Capsaspora owczarzaki ATCC 30864]|uniref:Uncharacterized protein n=1 Tax=Capsaspora owczarzaki (strain ATCC 30864) TaxID=595528 RepID=A0A0D2WND7_CAPO3|nr:hypothetical protein CAOG_009606 [Capsaspora owczarzaki ATCC 30864]